MNWNPFKKKPKELEPDKKRKLQKLQRLYKKLQKLLAESEEFCQQAQPMHRAEAERVLKALQEKVEEAEECLRDIIGIWQDDGYKVDWEDVENPSRE